MSRVSLALDVHLNRRVAIKQAAGGASSDAQLLSEGRALAVVRHRNLPAVHSFGVHRGRPFLALEYIAGPTLAQVIADHVEHRMVISAPCTARVVGALADALSALHVRGLIHCDLTPSNVILEHGTGRAVLIDLGLTSRYGDPLQMATDRVMGTPAYMAPESVLGRARSPATDQYALACVAHEMLTGHKLVEGDVTSVLSSHASGRLSVAELTKPEHGVVADVLSRALRKQADERYPTTLAFARALERAVESYAYHIPFGTVREAQLQLSPGFEVMLLSRQPALSERLRRAVEAALGHLAPRVLSHDDATSALTRLATRVSHIVVVDEELLRDGLSDFLARVRAAPAGGDSEVLVVRADERDHSLLRFATLGVGELVDGRCTTDELTAVIARMAEHRAADGVAAEAPTRRLRSVPPGPDAR